MAQDTKTINGAMKTAICVLEPTEIAKDKSILFFPATVTAVKCSAALPNSGRRMMPMKRCGICSSSAASSREWTKISAMKETRMVATTNSMAASRFAMEGLSWCAPSVANNEAWVLSWNNRNNPYIKRSINDTILDN